MVKTARVTTIIQRDHFSEDNHRDQDHHSQDSLDNRRDHPSEDNHTHQDHHRKDNRGNKDNPVISIQIPKVSNKRKRNRDIKLITIKPPTKEQMKITRRKNSVVATPPDKNQ